VVTGYAVFALVLLFFFMGETYWDRRPRQIEVARGMQNRLSKIISSNSKAANALATANHNGKDANKNATVHEHIRGEQPVIVSETPVITESHEEPGWAAKESKTVVEQAEYLEPASGPTWTHINDSVPLEHQDYTERLKHSPAKAYAETLKPYSGRINQDSWLKVAVRPFILYSYPAVLWSSLV
jgi:hypothetical protein